MSFTSQIITGARSTYLFCFLHLLCLMFFNSCFQTKTLVSNPDEYLNKVSGPLYCGTYSSFIYYDKESNAVLNYSLTVKGDAIYDSIIRKRVKKLSFSKADFVKDTSSALDLAKELSNIIQHAEKSGSIKNYRNSGILSNLTKDYVQDHYVFFVPTGYIRSPENLKKELTHPSKTKRFNAKEDISVLIATMLFTGLIGTAIIFSAKYDNRPTGHGSNCYIIVYNKTVNQVSLYRQQFFVMDAVKPLERKYLKKQVDYLLKEYL